MIQIESEERSIEQSASSIKHTVIIDTDIGQSHFTFFLTFFIQFEYMLYNLKAALQCTVPQNFKLRPMRYICFDLVKACEGVFLLCFLGQIVTWQYNPYLLD